jgi:SAM-dependent methyltransferase
MSEPVTCTVCGSAGVGTFLRIEAAPVSCSQICCSLDEALGVPTAPIALGFCGGCGHIFNTEYSSAALNYRPGYENALDGSESFRAYDDALVDDLLSRYRLNGRVIVEIGCGRGRFLRALCERGANSGVGFDPSYSGDSVGKNRAGDVVIYPEVYGARQLELRADFICSRHTLEHVGEPRVFLSSIREAARRAGVPVFFEVPNGLYTLRDGGIWDVIYEHCSYFTPSSLARLFQETGYAPAGVTETFAGQFLTIDAVTGSSMSAAAPAVSQNLERMVSAFAQSFEAKLEAWSCKLRKFEEDGRKVIVWGAGAKATMFLNLVKPAVVDYVIDVNPRKHDKYVTGTGQRIVPPEFLCDYPVDEIICMNPNYIAEITSRTRALGSGANLLTA